MISFFFKKNSDRKTILEQQTNRAGCLYLTDKLKLAALLVTLKRNDIIRFLISHKQVVAAGG